MKLPTEAIDELRQLYLELDAELTDKQLKEEGEDLLRLFALSRGIVSDEEYAENIFRK